MTSEGHCPLACVYDKSLLLVHLWKLLTDKYLEREAYHCQTKEGVLPMFQIRRDKHCQVSSFYLGTVIGCLLWSSSVLAFGVNQSYLTNRNIGRTVPLHMSQKYDEDDGMASRTRSIGAAWTSTILPNLLKSLVTLGLAGSIAFPSFASDSGNLLVGEKYWTIMNEGALACVSLSLLSRTFTQNNVLQYCTCITHILDFCKQR